MTINIHNNIPYTAKTFQNKKEHKRYGRAILKRHILLKLDLFYFGMFVVH